MTEGEARRRVAEGAARAGGERAARRRRTTPLLASRNTGTGAPGPDARDPETTPSGVKPSGVNGSSPDAVPRAPAKKIAESADAAAPAPAKRTKRAAAKPKATAEPTPAEAKPALTTPTTPSPPPAPAAPTSPRGRRPVPRVRVAASRRTPGGEQLVAVADAARQLGEELAGLAGRVDDVTRDSASGSGIEERLAGLLAFVRRRLTGDFAVDEFGFDPELTDTVLLNLFRPLYRRWFRVDVRGIENIPSTGGALVVANHSGAIALDALMTQIAVHDEHPAHRHLRVLGADLVFSTPVLGELARKGGATLASNADAERLLGKGELVGVWPEGFKGIGKPFSERYKLQRFGRGGFVSAALKTGTPIVPCAIVGAEETYPIIGNMPSVARLLGMPYAPVTPTWPLLGLLGLIPLPSKWLIEFCAPVTADDTGASTTAADDPMTVFDLTDQIRQTIQQTLYSLLVQRRSVFF